MPRDTPFFPPFRLLNFPFYDLFNPYHLGKFVTVFLMIVQPVMIFGLAKRFKEERLRLAAMLSAAALVWLNAYGRNRFEFSGMGRYLLPVLPLFVPVALPAKPVKPGLQRFLVRLAMVLGFLAQVVYISLFIRKKWVA